MSLFDQLVAQALKNRAALASLQVVVEKELLHHDILRGMSKAGLLANLTFIGGTCLRACYGASRLSEDLDFTGGADFRRETLLPLGPALTAELQAKYDFKVVVKEPTREQGNVDTWKLSIMTRPPNMNRPAQRINIDICAVPSHDRRPMMLRNHYGVDMGTSGLIIQVQSREEILADKILALALRPNRLKNRDLWDIAWLKQQGVRLPLALLPQKISDRHIKVDKFLELLHGRSAQLGTDPQVQAAFALEMQRFLPATTAVETVGQDAFWEYLTTMVQEECNAAVAALSGTGQPRLFAM